MVYRRKEADVSVLQREGGSEEDVQQPLGEATCHVWTTFGLASVLGGVAACYHWICARHQLRPGSGVTCDAERDKTRHTEMICTGSKD